LVLDSNRPSAEPDILAARILLIDGDTRKVALVRTLLRIGGFTDCRVELDTKNAATAFREYDPDLIITDFESDDQRGSGVLSQLKPVIPKNAYLPFLVLTPDNSRETRQAALASGAMDFVSKPFCAEEILLRIQSLLTTRMLHLQLQAEKERLESTG
jgi:response regulator RpfG family c-di-GMP phosphodiesterase